MQYQHKELASGRWNNFSLAEQMANIGSEVERAIKWRKKEKFDYSQRALERALELLDLSAKDLAKQKKTVQIREILRVREALVDYFCFDNTYHSSDQKWQNYFLFFNYIARAKKASNS